MMCKKLNINESKARKLLKKACIEFGVSPLNCFFVDINDSGTIGWYEEKHSNLFAYAMVEKYWSRGLVIVLHELAHHIQEELYEWSRLNDTMHGKAFQLAKSRVATWAKKNLSNDIDWGYMIQRQSQGKLTKYKKKKKKK
jgi:hypothetical protein